MLDFFPPLQSFGILPIRRSSFGVTEILTVMRNAWVNMKMIGRVLQTPPIKKIRSLSSSIAIWETRFATNDFQQYHFQEVLVSNQSSTTLSN